MSAAHHTLAELVEGDDVVVEPRRRTRDRIRSYIRTTPGGPIISRHVHCAMVLSEDGNGQTSPGPDGHVHRVIALEIQIVFGHTHDISATRCPEDHDRKTGRHVEKRR